MNDGRVWRVISYPHNEVLHTTDSYSAADVWRNENNLVSYICPHWPQNAPERGSPVLASPNPPTPETSVRSPHSGQEPTPQHDGGTDETR